MKEHKVLQALEALAENDRHNGVPPIVEMRLIQAFRARRPKRTFPSWAAVCSIAAAASLLAVVTAQHRPRHIPAPKPSAEVGREERAAAAAITETPKAAAHPMRPIMPKRPPNPTRIEEQNATRQEQNATRQEQTATELFTDFFPLMDPAPPFNRGEILRVQVPATAMRAVGLPVGDDHLADQIQADVLVGEEGLPRAIRFVKFEMK
jgi:hypothetical protein